MDYEPSWPNHIRKVVYSPPLFALNSKACRSGSHTHLDLLLLYVGQRYKPKNVSLGFGDYKHASNMKNKRI